MTLKTLRQLLSIQELPDETEILVEVEDVDRSSTEGARFRLDCPVDQVALNAREQIVIHCSIAE